MKKDLSALDIHFLLEELTDLIDAKIDKIFLEEDTLLLQMHVSGKGKKWLKAMLPSLLFLTEAKGEFSSPSRFCLSLRKFLNNARLRKINQIGFERIVEFIFEAKDGLYILILEMFSNGNIVLCREDYRIIIAKTYKRYSSRTIRGNIKYEHPKKDIDVTELYLDDTAKILKNTEKESLVKSLAIDFGLGGIYSEEVCLLAGIDKNKTTLSDKDVNTVFQKIKLLLGKNIKATFYENTDVTPFELELYKGKEKKDFKSFNSAIETLAGLIHKDIEKSVMSETETKKKRILSIIKKQENDILALKKDADLNQKKAELIYTNYQKIDEIIQVLRQAREKFSWKDIKKKLKGHSEIKEINEKEGKVVVEI
ncbi:MAG: NFACT family protein [Nanoarchaeota archaeon]|nr:NFACT family protein [Nanoarchaeota archaeon]